MSWMSRTPHILILNMDASIRTAEIRKFSRLGWSPHSGIPDDRKSGGAASCRTLQILARQDAVPTGF